MAYTSHEVQLDLSDFLQFPTVCYWWLGPCQEIHHQTLHAKRPPLDLPRQRSSRPDGKQKYTWLRYACAKHTFKKDHNKREKRRRDSIVLIISLPWIFQQRMYSTVLRMYSTWHNDKYWLMSNDEWVTTNELVLRSSHLPGTASRVTLEKNLVVNR